MGNLGLLLFQVSFYSEGGASAVKEDSLGPRCSALSQALGQVTGGVMKSHQSHWAGPGSCIGLPTLSFSLKWPTDRA